MSQPRGSVGAPSVTQPETTVRDSHRQRLYDAEQQVRRQLELAAAGARTVTVAASTVVLPLEVHFGSLDAVRRYVDALRGSDEFARRFPTAAATPLRVRLRRGEHHAHYEPPGTIALHDPQRGSAWALRELVVLHEVAHHAAHHDLAPEPAHGPRYAGAFQWLAGHAMGGEVALLLRTAFAEHGVAATPL